VYRSTGRNATSGIVARLEFGSRIASWLAAHPLDADVVGVWKRIAVEVFNMQYTDATRHRLRRAYHEWRDKKYGGAATNLGAGAITRSRRRRSTESVHTSASAVIGFELLQWFVDEIISVKCRADSSLLMNYAHGLRIKLLDHGTPSSDLPKINKGWLYRWRQHHNVSIRRGTTTFKVSHAKACDRVAVMLGNIFRLRVYPITYVDASVWRFCD
jgi:hypothetical protein